MKLKVSHLILVSILSLLFGCTPNETAETKLAFPEDIPDFVLERDMEDIDWDNRAENFAGNILGNKNKSGVIGASMPSLQVQKWMWHLWGIENPATTSLTVVGLHKDTGTVHQILTSGWTTSLAGENNGADAHTPSNVSIPKAGEWAILLYTDEELFDVLIYEINE